MLRTGEAEAITGDPDLKEYAHRQYTYSPTNFTVAAEAIRDYPLAHRLYVAALLVFIFRGPLAEEEQKNGVTKLLRTDDKESN